jgi:hypothetical protein
MTVSIHIVVSPELLEDLEIRRAGRPDGLAIDRRKACERCSDARRKAARLIRVGMGNHDDLCAE